MHAAFRRWQITSTYWHFLGFGQGRIKMISENLDSYAISQIKGAAEVRFRVSIGVTKFRFLTRRVGQINGMKARQTEAVEALL